MFLLDATGGTDECPEVQQFNNYLVAFGAAVGIVALQQIARCFMPRWGESRRETIGRIIKKVPQIQAQYNAEIEESNRKQCEEIKKSWEKFGKLITKMPEEGFTEQQIREKIDFYAKVTNTPLQGVHHSGTIYSDIHFKKTEDEDSEEVDEEESGKLSQNQRIARTLQRVLPYAYSKSNHWNLLHGEFAVGNVLAYQVGQMVADLFGAKRGETRCLFSTGGTGSLILACKIYQEWGIENKGHNPGQSVILAPDTIHAAVLKATKYFIRVKLVKTDENGNVDMNDLRGKVTKHENDLVAIFGTAPAYPRGTVNPIKEMAKIADKHRVGFHVDSCLGGFIINFHPDYDTDYFKMIGVTSISADPHKFAEAPKGSSVCMFKKLGKKNLTYYSAKINAKPFWAGGVYGSLTEPGSQTVVHIFEAYIALLVAGKRGLREIAEGIFACIKQMKGRIKVDLKHQIKLVGDGKVNVFAFRVHPALKLEKGASYALSHELKTRKFVLNNMKGDFIHFCITSRVTGDEDVVDKFIKALKESMGAVIEMNRDVKSGKKQFPGDAGLYGDLDAACSPKRKEMSKGKYFENFVFGERGAVDKVAGHFGAILDPFQFDEK